MLFFEDTKYVKPIVLFGYNLVTSNKHHKKAKFYIPSFIVKIVKLNRYGTTYFIQKKTVTSQDKLASLFLSGNSFLIFFKAHYLFK